MAAKFEPTSSPSISAPKAAADHLVTHCMAFLNGAKGFDQNNNTGAITLVNNLAWKNGTWFGKPNYSFPSRPNVFINNISFQGADEDRLSAGESSWRLSAADSSPMTQLAESFGSDEAATTASK